MLCIDPAVYLTSDTVPPRCLVWCCSDCTFHGGTVLGPCCGTDKYMAFLNVPLCCALTVDRPWLCSCVPRVFPLFSYMSRATLFNILGRVADVRVAVETLEKWTRRQQPSPIWRSSPRTSRTLVVPLSSLPQRPKRLNGNFPHARSFFQNCARTFRACRSMPPRLLYCCGAHVYFFCVRW